MEISITSRATEGKMYILQNSATPLLNYYPLYIKRTHGRKFTIVLFVVTKTGNESSVQLQEPG